MVDYRKIDAFFNGEKQFELKTGTPLNRRARVLRFAKLAMPSAAALLLGGILLWPTLKDQTIVSQKDITLPKKGELEKLHIEQTVFSITDKDNKVNTFTADTIDETEPGSKVMKINNPKGEIPSSDGKMFYIDAQTGYYNQEASTLKAVENVKIVYDAGTTVLTENAEYDFKKAFGYGTEKVYAYGAWGKLWADGFTFHKNQNLLTLTGRSKIVNEGRTLWADKEVRYYHVENRLEAEGNVKILEENNTLYADKMIAYFKDGSDHTIEKAESFGNVRVDTADGTAIGDYGLYLPEKNELQLQGNVLIMQNGHSIKGDRATTNLATGVSKVLASPHGEKRVSGVIKGNSIKGK